MKKTLWILALLFSAIAVLGYYNIVTIKGVSNYNFEMLLIGFVILLALKFFKI